MAQISRPFQIALIAVGLLVAVWFVALRGHSPSTSSSGAGAAPTSTTAPAAPAHPTAPAAPSAAVSAAGEAKAAAAPTPIYHGAAPGVEGLTRAIDKAHGAVATSQQDAKHFEGQSAEAATATAPAATASSPAATASTSTTVTKVTTTAIVKSPASKGSGATRAAALLSGQRAVEAELKRGDMVVLLFWNPAGADDVAVRNALRPLNSPRRKIVVHEASANQVALFGSITKGVQVDATPTVLIINKAGNVSSLVGLTDTYSVEQAIDEARS